MKKIAFCFLIYDIINHEELWNIFFQNVDTNKYTIYIHYKFNKPLKYFENYKLNNCIETNYADITIVKAQNLLLQRALDNSDNQLFIFISDSCIPLKSFEYIYENLNEKYSYFNIQPQSQCFPRCDDTLKFIDKKYIQKSSQWCILNRKHTELMVNNSDYIEWFNYSSTIPDEHCYITNIFYNNLQDEIITTTNLSNNATTFTNWEGMDYKYPSQKGLKNYSFIIENELLYLLNSKCFFGRKFLKECSSHLTNKKYIEFIKSKSSFQMSKHIKSINNNIITFSTCWYILKSKFTTDKYLSWIKNLVSIVNNFNLVIYTDHISYKNIVRLISLNKKIKVIIKPFENFYTYKYKDNWIKNHQQSKLDLHNIIDWKVNMLWNEKVFFVKETIMNTYFDTPYYGWCDIGYFRNGKEDLHTHFLKSWPSNKKLLKEPFNNYHYIHYGRVQRNNIIYDTLTNDIKNHYNLVQTNGPPIKKYNEICFSGGFFILKSKIIDYYSILYNNKLDYYFKNNYFIKDDQTIIQDLIITNPKIFCIHTEDNINFNNWFMFQRILL